ncbi:unnamed protein product, partial [Closterium sp. NIES-65]
MCTHHARVRVGVGLQQQLLSNHCIFLDSPFACVTVTAAAAAGSAAVRSLPSTVPPPPLTLLYTPEVGRGRAWEEDYVVKLLGTLQAPLCTPEGGGGGEERGRAGCAAARSFPSAAPLLPPAPLYTPGGLEREGKGGAQLRHLRPRLYSVRLRGKGQGGVWHGKGSTWLDLNVCMPGLGREGCTRGGGGAQEA